MKLKLDLDPKLPSVSLFNRRNRYTELVMSSKSPVIVRKGLEFDHYREYSSTDDARLIDWKASVRSGHLQVRVFQEDKAVSSLILIDTSATMLFGTGEKLKVEYAFEMASSLLYGILNDGDKTGLLLYNDEIFGYYTPDTGLPYFGILQDALHNFDNFGGMANIVEPIFRICQNHREFHIVIFISDFLQVDDDFQKFLATIPSTLGVIGIMILDPSDIHIPPDIGLVSFRDPITKEVRIINTGRAAEEYTRQNQERIAKVQKTFDRIDGDFIFFTTDEPYEEKILQFIEFRNMREN